MLARRTHSPQSSPLQVPRTCEHLVIATASSNGPATTSTTDRRSIADMDGNLRQRDEADVAHGVDVPDLADVSQSPFLQPGGRGKAGACGSLHPRSWHDRQLCLRRKSSSRRLILVLSGLIGEDVGVSTSTYSFLGYSGPAVVPCRGLPYRSIHRH